MIDLHTHTTASDGRCTPGELVVRAAAAGVTVLSVTDHDTVAGCDATGRGCRAAGIEFVPGIEITAVREGLDVHILGYFIDTRSPELHAFLATQRERRISRVREMIDRLAARGIRLDAEAIVQPAIDDPSKSAGRPWIARALVAARVVKDTAEAFDRWLGRGRPAFVPRTAAAPEEVFVHVHDAGGIASIAHPGLVGHDEWLQEFAAAGIDALEAYHTEHTPDMTARYLAIAARLKLAVSGGSDFHADESHGASNPGSVSLPREHYDRLVRLKPDTTGEQRAGHDGRNHR